MTERIEPWHKTAWRALLRALLVFALLAAVFDFGDYLSLRFRVPHRDPFPSVEVYRDYAIKLKDKRINYTQAITEQQECASSLLPHFGDDPCWYVRSHTHQHIEIDSGPPGPLIDTP